MSAFWLKMIGTSVDPWPVGKPYNLQHIGFRGLYKPSGIRSGDRMVLYAVGAKRIFGLVEVTKDWYESNQDGWPYRVDIRCPAEVSLAPNDGVDVDELSTELKSKLRRRSHLRLTSEQYERAANKLREASKR